MNIVIETNRLLLQELTLEDSDKLSLVLTDPVSMKYYPRPFTSEEVKNWILWNIENYKKYGFGLWAVILKDGNEFIGDCGITMQEVEEQSYPEIGYHIIKEYWRKGYASEAAKACIDFAFTAKKMETVISYMKADNIPSRGVAEKNGMHFVKYFDKVVRGENVKEALYMITKKN